MHREQGKRLAYSIPDVVEVTGLALATALHRRAERGEIARCGDDGLKNASIPPAASDRQICAPIVPLPSTVACVRWYASAMSTNALSLPLSPILSTLLDD